MTAILDGQAYRRIAPFRAESESPRDPRCKLALRRICGTCQHYRGDLKPPRIGHDKAEIDTADCARFSVKKHRLEKAWSCTQWTRKGPGNV